MTKIPKNHLTLQKQIYQKSPKLQKKNSKVKTSKILLKPQNDQITLKILKMTKISPQNSKNNQNIFKISK